MLDLTCARADFCKKSKNFLKAKSREPLKTREVNCFIDTTNVANIEVVPGISYVSSNHLTYIVDDDIVINGWYFLNGEPKLYVRETPENGAVSWGRSQLSRYKTFALREWLWRTSDNYLYKELYLYTPYLATINNLGTPVIKTADKTMKITYTITEE